MYASVFGTQVSEIDTLLDRTQRGKRRANNDCCDLCSASLFFNNSVLHFIYDQRSFGKHQVPRIKGHRSGLGSCWNISDNNSFLLEPTTNHLKRDAKLT